MGKHGKDHNMVPITPDMTPQEKADEFDALERQNATEVANQEPSKYPAFDAYYGKGQK
ncbi:MAG TPA: hypothetical protein VIY48_09170 [Candidatus Paceibacterota bacterium]